MKKNLLKKILVGIGIIIALGLLTANVARAISILTVQQGGTGVGTITGIVKGNGTAAFSAAVSGTDYLPITGGTGITTLGTITAGTWHGSTIDNAYLTNSTISGIALGSNLNALTATNTTLTFSGSYNGSTARTVGLNLGNANTWTGQQTFSTSAPIFSTITGSTQCLHVDSSGLLSGTGSDCGAGAGGASTALDNLAAVAINTSLISDTDNTDDLGSATKEWKDIYIDGTAYVDAIDLNGTGLTATGTELNYVSGVTSAIQTQLDGKVKTDQTVGQTIGTTGARLTKLWATDITATNAITGSVTGNAGTATALATGRTISISGDLTYTSPAFDGSGDVTAAGTLATVNGNVGSFGSSTSIPSFTVNGKGLITAASGNVVVAPAGTLSGTTLNATVVTSSLTSVGTIGTGVWNAGAVTSSGKITANASLDVKNGATTAGVLAIFEDSDDGTNKATFTVPALAGDTVYILPPDDGDAGEQLQTNGTGTLTWETAGSGAPADADYLVGTANGSLSAEIVVGTSPGGELGGTWASPTIDDGVAVSNWVLTSPTITTGIEPTSSDGAALGTGTKMFSDLFLASGGVLNFNNGNATITHSAGLLTSNVDIAVPDEAYGSGWNGSLEVPTKNAVYDKIETVGAGSVVTLTATQDLTVGQLVGASNISGGIAKAVNTTVTSAHGITTPLFDGKRIQGFAPIGGDKFVMLNYTAASSDTLFAQVGSIDRAAMTVTLGTANAVATSFTPVATSLHNTAIAKLDTDKFIAFYLLDASTTVIKYRVGTVVGTTISYGTEGTASTAGAAVNGGTSSWTADQLGTDKGVFCYKVPTTTTASKCIVFTVSGTTPTFGTEVTPGTESQKAVMSIVKKIATDKFVLVSNVASGSLYGEVSTVSGTTQTKGTEVQISTAGSTPQDEGFEVVNPATDVFVVGFGSTETMVACTVATRTITPGTTISANTKGGIYAASATEIYGLTGSSTNSSITTYALSGTTLTAGAALAQVYVGMTPFHVIPIDNGYMYQITGLSNASNVTSWIQGMSNNFIGVVQSTVSRGNTASVIVAGVDANQTGLAAGNIYQVTTGGALTPISTRATLDQTDEQWTVKAISSTQIVI